MREYSEKTTIQKSFPQGERVSRVRAFLDRKGIKQKDLAEAIEMEPQNLSRCMVSGKISEKTCRKIADCFPGVRVEYLLGLDPYMTEEEKEEAEKREALAHDLGLRVNAPLTVLDTALQEICSLEGIEVPNLDNLGEYLLLEAQLKDYAYSLMWRYLHRDCSHFWNTLDQELEAIENKLKK